MVWRTGSMWVTVWSLGSSFAPGWTGGGWGIPVMGSTPGIATPFGVRCARRLSRLEAAACSAHGFRQGFERALRIAFRQRDLHLRGHARGDAGSHRGARLQVEVERAGEEGLHHMQVRGFEASDGVGRQSAFGLGLLLGEEGLSAQEGVRRAVVRRQFVYDDGPGSKIAEPLVLAVAEHRDYAGKIEAGEKVDEAQEVAREGFEEADLPATVLDDAQLHDVLAGRLAMPERLKEREVAHDEAEDDERDGREEPLCSGVELRGLGRMVVAGQQRKREDDDDQRGDLDQVIDQQRHKTAADSGDRKAQVYLLGRFDVKLVGEACLLKLHDLEPLD